MSTPFPKPRFSGDVLPYAAPSSVEPKDEPPRPARFWADRAFPPGYNAATRGVARDATLAGFRAAVVVVMRDAQAAVAAAGKLNDPAWTTEARAIATGLRDATTARDIEGLLYRAKRLLRRFAGA